MTERQNCKGDNFSSDSRSSSGDTNRPCSSALQRHHKNISGCLSLKYFRPNPVQLYTVWVQWPFVWFASWQGFSPLLFILALEMSVICQKLAFIVRTGANGIHGNRCRVCTFGFPGNLALLIHVSNRKQWKVLFKAKIQLLRWKVIIILDLLVWH